MEAYRQIVDIKNHTLNLQLPKNFKNGKVEVIILRAEEEKSTKRIANLRGKLNLSDAQYNDFQENVKNSREEWEKNT